MWVDRCLSRLLTICVINQARLPVRRPGPVLRGAAFTCGGHCAGRGTRVLPWVAWQSGLCGLAWQDT